MSILARGIITSFTASFRSSAFTLDRPSSAASAFAAFTANSSPLCPCTTPRMHSITRYSTCSSEMEHSLSHSLAKRICVRAPAVASSASAAAVAALFWNFIAMSTAVTRSWSCKTWSALRVTAMRSSKCSLSAPSSGLNVAMSRGRHGCLNVMPSRSTTFSPSANTVNKRLETDSSRRLISSTYRIPRCASASSPG